jgi:hypothetical protein
MKYIKLFEEYSFKYECFAYLDSVLKIRISDMEKPYMDVYSKDREIQTQLGLGGIWDVLRTKFGNREDLSDIADEWRWINAPDVFVQFIKKKNPQAYYSYVKHYGKHPSEDPSSKHAGHVTGKQYGV